MAGVTETKFGTTVEYQHSVHIVQRVCVMPHSMTNKLYVHA